MVKIFLEIKDKSLRLALLGALALLLAAGGCASRSRLADSITATATATVNPTLPPAEARREANTRAETQARDQIMILAGQTPLPDGRTLEDAAVADATARAELYDTVRDAHLTDRTVSAEGVITITLAVEKSAIQRIISNYQKRSGK